MTQTKRTINNWLLEQVQEISDSMRSPSVKRVEWRVQHASLLQSSFPQGKEIRSPTFVAAGLESMQLVLYPSGYAGATEHFCSIFLFAPAGVRMNGFICAGKHKHKIHHTFEMAGAFGITNFGRFEKVVDADDTLTIALEIIEASQDSTLVSSAQHQILAGDMWDSGTDDIPPEEGAILRYSASPWNTEHCAICTTVFSKRRLTLRQHCGICARSVCSACSPSNVQLEGCTDMQRACTECISNAAKVPAAQSRIVRLGEQLDALGSKCTGPSPVVAECTNLEEALDFSEFVVSQLEDLQGRLADKKAQSGKLAEALETERRARAQLEQELQVRKKTTKVVPKQDPSRVSENLEEELDFSEFIVGQLEDFQDFLATRDVQSDKLVEALETEKCARAQLEQQLHKRKKTTWNIPKQDPPRVSENLEEALSDSEFVIEQLEDLQDRLGTKKAQSVMLGEALETEKRSRAQLEKELRKRKKTTWKIPKQDSPQLQTGKKQVDDEIACVLQWQVQ